MRRAGRMLGVLALCAALPAACADANRPPGAVGSSMPAYSAMTMDGEVVALEDLRDGPVLLNVWATWCPPCRREIPELQALHREFADRGLTVVGVTVDAAGARSQVEEFIAEFGMEYLVLRDPHEAIAPILGVVGMPTTVLIDRRGMIRWRHLGAVMADDPALRETLRIVL